MSQPAPELPKPDSSRSSERVQQHSLAVADIIKQWDVTSPFGVEAVCQHYPQRDWTTSELVDLAYEEFCRQREQGVEVDPASFARRYPTLEHSLCQLLQVHCGLLSIPLDERSLLKLPETWPELGTIWLGFEILELLGTGAFSRVYLAREPAVGDRRVVVKATVLGQAEAGTLGKMDHPHVVPILSVDYDPETRLHAVCMPLQGRWTTHDIVLALGHEPQVPTRNDILRNTLTEPALAKASENVPVEQPELAPETYVDSILTIAIEICSALSAAHDKGILHLDVKPSNILLTRTGHGLLIDFNLATDSNLNTRALGGTLPYMAPEQIRNLVLRDSTVKLTAQADIFSLGATIYHLLSGRFPFGELPDQLSPREAASTLLLRHKEGARALSDWNPAVDRDLSETIRSCMAENREQRIKSADELLQRLRRCRSWRGRLARYARRHPRTVWVSSLAGLLLLGSWLTWQALRPSFVERQREAAQNHLALHDLKSAIGNFDTILAIEPGDVEARFLRCLTLYRLGKLALAFDDAEILEASLKDGRGAALLGQLCVAFSSDWVSGSAKFEAAIQQGFRTPVMYNNLGQALFKNGRLREARAAFDEALRHNRQLPSAWVGVASVELRQALNAGGLPSRSLMQEALKRDQKSADLHFLDGLYRAVEVSQLSPGPAREKAWSECLQACDTALDLGLPTDRLKELLTVSDEFEGADGYQELVKRAAENRPKYMPTILLLDPFSPNDADHVQVGMR